MNTFRRSFPMFFLLCWQFIGGSLGQESDKAAAIALKRSEVDVRQADLDTATAQSIAASADVGVKSANLDVVSANRKRAQVEFAIAKQVKSSRVAELQRKNELLTCEEVKARRELTEFQAKANATKARVKETEAALLVAKLDLEVTAKPSRDGRKRFIGAQLKLCEARLASAEAMRAVADGEIAAAKAKLTSAEAMRAVADGEIAAAKAKLKTAIENVERGANGQ